MKEYEDYQTGMDEHTSVASLMLAGGPGMAARMTAGITAIDIIRQLYLYYMASEPTPGAAKEIYERMSRQVVELIERPSVNGIFGIGYKTRDWLKLHRVVKKASTEYSSSSVLVRRHGNLCWLPSIKCRPKKFWVSSSTTREPPPSATRTTATIGTRGGSSKSGRLIFFALAPLRHANFNWELLTLELDARRSNQNPGLRTSMKSVAL